MKILYILSNSFKANKLDYTVIDSENFYSGVAYLESVIKRWQFKCEKWKKS